MCFEVISLFAEDLKEAKIKIPLHHMQPNVGKWEDAYNYYVKSIRPVPHFYNKSTGDFKDPKAKVISSKANYKIFCWKKNPQT